MIYLSGVFSRLALGSGHPNLGLMVNPNMWNDLSPLGSIQFGADNGCFRQGASFDPEVWLRWLERLGWCRHNCLFAVAPDVLGDPRATLIRSLLYLDRIAQLGFPRAFVSQDGCTSSLVPWDSMEVLFVGGSTKWKLSEASYSLVAEARERGKRTHMGRVNSVRRIAACIASRIDSADGTLLAFGDERNWPVLEIGLDLARQQIPLLGASSV